MVVRSFLYFLLICLLGVSPVWAQIPNDLSLVKASQISDIQLSEFVRKAQTSRLSEAELLSEFQKRGLPDSELQVLVARVRGMMGNENAKSQAASDGGSVKRVYKGDASLSAPQPNPSRVFGAELFSSSNPLFVPNLKIATPKSYVIGPEDELQLDIFGNNISSQKLVVSPDGMVNVKYAGPVNLSGITIEQASALLKARLTKFYPSLATNATRLQLTLGSVRSIQVMVIGAVQKPGTMTLPSIATLFNALYASGGPTENGSFRSIELVRDNKVIEVADLYDFILKGDQHSNLALRDRDVIRIPFAKVQVTIDGALNRTGIFEVKPAERLIDVIGFAGGFQSNAFKGRITGSRYTDTERKVIDIAKEDFATFNLMHGDALNVKTVVEKYENRVVVMGAVFKPGAYSLEPGMDLKGLIAKSQGLAEGAFTGRATLVRIKDDLTKEFVDVDLQKQLNGQQSILLKKEDSLHVYFVQDLKDRPVVVINGAIRTKGEYPYEDSLTLQGLILKAGGFIENAYVSKIEIGRRRKGVDQTAGDAKIAEIIEVTLDKDLKKIGEDILLQPYDQVSIKTDPGVVPQKKVAVSGQVLLPGSYTMESNADVLSSLIKRCGGLLPTADINAVKLLRKNRGIQAKEVERVAEATLKFDSSVLNKEEIASLSKSTVEVALDINKALRFPGSRHDITLEEGDQLVVPQMNYIVNVSGEVQKPIAVQYDPSLNMKQYINLAGGYAVRAARNRAFVVYPNGKSQKLKHALGLIRLNPKVTPGATVFVPKKEERQNKGFDPSKAGILVSALSAVMTGLVLLFR